MELCRLWRTGEVRTKPPAIHHSMSACANHPSPSAKNASASSVLTCSQPLRPGRPAFVPWEPAAALAGSRPSSPQRPPHPFEAQIQLKAQPEGASPTLQIIPRSATQFIGAWSPSHILLALYHDIGLHLDANDDRLMDPQAPKEVVFQREKIKQHAIRVPPNKADDRTCNSVQDELRV